MKPRPQSRSSQVPPLWLTVLLAVVLALGLLGAFVGVLRDHIRHSDEARRMFGHPAPHAASARSRLAQGVQVAATATLPAR
jgi:hypothetical protein